jgi:hypothetical protein
MRAWMLDDSARRQDAGHVDQRGRIGSRSVSTRAPSEASVRGRRSTAARTSSVTPSK